jgi:hypothetical protein
MIKISISGGGEFEGSETDVIKSFIIDDHAFVRVLNELMNGKGSVVWFDDGVGDLGRWDN